MRPSLFKKLETAGSLRGFREMPLGSKISLVVLIIVAAAAVFAPLVAPHDPLQIFSARQAPSAEHLFGTDEKGRDVLSRMIYGTRYSLLIGLLATGMAVISGALLGSIAAVSRKPISETVMRVMDIIMSFPGIALAAVYVSVFGNSLPIIIFAIGFLYVPQLTRVVRANVLSAFGEDYVSAALVAGARAPWILIKHVMRNTIAPVMVFATILVADAIVFEASLTFIQAGIGEPTPTWGNILSDARQGVLAGRWWQALFPGLAIMITVLCLNILSEGLTDAMVATPDKKVSAAVVSSSKSDAVLVDPVAAHRIQEPDLLARLESLRQVEADRTDRRISEGDSAPLLEVEHLSISFPRHGDVNVVDDVSFSVASGETMGLVGESGCGKSITALAIMGLLDPKAQITGSVKYLGEDLLGCTPVRKQELLGREIAIIYQDALSALNPSMLIKSQIAQLTRRGGTRSAIELLELVGLDPARTLNSYPHELSGGQRQRVLIAMALTRDPKLIIADEPTTALDVTVQRQVIDLLEELGEKLGFAMVFVSHDLALVAEVAHAVTVMYAGQVVEQGPTRDLLMAPQHEYTRGLLGAVLSIEAGAGRLHQVPGTVPSPKDFPLGDRFAPRSSRPDWGLDVRPVLARVGNSDHYHAVHPEDHEAQRGHFTTAPQGAPEQENRT
ncbi:dipeptide/oligopeptide/nickel ABC transporter permease/ATP-binding protein [Nesterenkonia haasae]|uniref:dipeptide/oligopeptide/nickel ABC transporter permease/ATP-binding protein n=1 Tax=Nesterenkonia haasae TaxID=2587813 RepID=UPI0013919ABD|nr:dipeptide/oligopeptide/nickel ABC transporter permease/ATP-binding protein [Nesterenkonia haasae]NDK31687.1 dipeptide/oligopeptide/nickel ABC transporter permease/ATP-binding protein [Nesterenkonia haasae]